MGRHSLLRGKRLFSVCVIINSKRCKDNYSREGFSTIFGCNKELLICCFKSFFIFYFLQVVLVMRRNSLSEFIFCGPFDAMGFYCGQARIVCFRNYWMRFGGSLYRFLYYLFYVIIFCIFCMATLT